MQFPILDFGLDHFTDVYGLRQWSEQQQYIQHAWEVCAAMQWTCKAEFDIWSSMGCDSVYLKSLFIMTIITIATRLSIEQTLMKPVN